jgi:hypothetical protein
MLTAASCLFGQLPRWVVEHQRTELIRTLAEARSGRRGALRAGVILIREANDRWSRSPLARNPDILAAVERGEYP